jgi:hypothetical protein
LVDDLQLVEDQQPAGGRDLRAQVFRRHVAWRGAIARQFHQRRKSVRVRDGVEEPSGIAEARRTD